MNKSIIEAVKAFKPNLTPISEVERYKLIFNEDFKASGIFDRRRGESVDLEYARDCFHYWRHENPKSLVELCSWLNDFTRNY